MNQKGIAQLALLFFLILGIGIGTYIVQNRTNILPRADCNPGINNNCDTGGGSEDEEQAEKEAAQKEEQQNLEKGAREAGKSVEDYKVDDCKANPGKGGCAEVLKRDAEKKSGGSGSSDPTDKCEDITYCDKENAVIKIASVDSSGKCSYSFKNKGFDNRCKVGAGQNENTLDGKVIDSGEAKRSGLRGNQVLTEEGRIAAQKKAADESKDMLDETRRKLDPNGKLFDANIQDDNKNQERCFASSREDREKAGIVITQAWEEYAKQDCERKVKILREISDSQNAYDYANTSGLTGISLTAAYDQAKLKARTASCDAVAAGIEGANCILDVGDRQNIITVQVKGKDVRVFMGCSATDNNEKGSCRKVLNFRGEDGKIHDLGKDAPDAAKTLLKDPHGDPNKIYDLDQLNTQSTSSIQNLCNASGTGCIAAEQASGQATTTSENVLQGGNESVTPASCKNYVANDGDTSGKCVIGGGEYTGGRETSSFVCQLDDKRYGGKGVLVNSIKDEIKKKSGLSGGQVGCDDDQLVKWWCDGIGKKDCEIKKAECLSSGVCKGSSTTQINPPSGQIHTQPYDSSKNCSNNNKCPQGYHCTKVGASVSGVQDLWKCFRDDTGKMYSERDKSRP